MHEKRKRLNVRIKERIAMTAIIIYKGSRRARNSYKYATIFIRSHLLFWKKYGFFWGYPKRKEIVFEE